MRPATSATSSRSGAYVGLLFAAYVVLQRVAVPGTPISLLLPLTVAWVAMGVRRGLVTLDRTRTLLWLAAVVATAAASVLQTMVGSMPIASLSSWGLLLASWAPLVATVRERDPEQFRVFLRWASTVAAVFAVLCLATTLTQALGLAYTDVVARIVPSPALLEGFNTNSATAYGESSYKANGWLGLEPSLASLELGVGLVAALLARRRVPVVLLIAAGMLCTLSGSGLVLVVVALVGMLCSRLRSLLLRFVLPAAAALGALALSSFGSSFIERAGEFSTPGSSGSIRGVEPYTQVIPLWVSHLDGLLLGFGPGSSQAFVNAPGIPGLIVPVPLKVFVDYGLVAGFVLAFFMVACHLGAPSRSLALALFVAYFSIQPMATLMVLVGQIGMFAAFWSPRPGRALESLGVGAAAVAVPAPRAPLTVPARSGGRHVA